MNNKILFITALVFVSIISYIYKEELLFLLVPIVILIKAKAIYFLNISKTKLLLFVKTLTIYKTLLLGTKRFIIDNYFSKWLTNNVINPIKEPITQYVKFFFKLGLKNKIKRIAYFILPMSVIIFIAQLTGILEHLLLFAELKAVVIGFFKIVWLVAGKIGGVILGAIFSLLKNTWLVSIIEIFALSWLMSKLEKIPYIGQYIVKSINFISKYINKFLSIFVHIYNKYIYTHISSKLKLKMEKIGELLTSFLEDSKHKNEIFIMKNFINEYVKEKNFKQYYEKIKLEGLYNKNEIYQKINEKTKDNVDINYYFNVDVNSLEKDVLIIESVASCNETGNKDSIITKDSFWVLNLSDKDVELMSLNDNFPNKLIKSGKIILVNSLSQDTEDMELKYGKEILKINKVKTKKDNKKNEEKN